jgi:integrase
MNNATIKDASAGATVWDDKVKGLHLRALATKKTFYLYYRTRAGVERRPKLGDFGSFTLHQAREMARNLLERVAQGEDPSNQWAVSKTEPTVADLYERVRVEKWGDGRSWSKEVDRLWRKEIAPRFGGERVSAVSVDDVEDWHRAYRDRPYLANRALAVLSRMFRRAERYRWRAAGSNPCNGVERFTERRRGRFARPEELARLGPALAAAAEDHPQAVAFLYLLLFSGSRPQAIADARWDQLTVVETDGRRFGVLEFEGKSTGATGELERVYLPPEAMGVIDRLPRTTGTITGLRSVPRAVWGRVRQEAGCPDLWARDFRRTFATVGMSIGHDKGVIGRLLNHHSAQTTDVYARLLDDKQREAAASTASAVAGMLKRTSG